MNTRYVFEATQELLILRCERLQLLHNAVVGVWSEIDLTFEICYDAYLLIVSLKFLEELFRNGRGWLLWWWISWPLARDSLAHVARSHC